MNKFKASTIWATCGVLLLVSVAVAQVSNPSLGKFVFDTLSNLKVSVQSCWSGESICIPTSPNSFLMVLGGQPRVITGATGIVTDTTSAVFTIPSGAKTPLGKVEGTGAIQLTLKLYGTYDVSTTVANAKLVCTVTLNSTTKHTKGCDESPQFTEDWPGYFIVSSNKTGTVTNGEMIIPTGITASGTSTGGAGDASAAKQDSQTALLTGIQTAVVGAVTSTVMATGVTTNTTSAAVALPKGSKSIYGSVAGTGVVAQTQKIYGGLTSDFTPATDGILLCTITLSGTTKAIDQCPPITSNDLFYKVVTEVTSGTGASGVITAMY